MVLRVFPQQGQTLHKDVIVSASNEPAKAHRQQEQFYMIGARRLRMPDHGNQKTSSRYGCQLLPQCIHGYT